eukprot:11688373-Ditylum_brightwellii.AAC.1
MDNKIMDIIKNVMPMSWQEEMQRQYFDCAAKGQAEFISFCKNLKLLDPPKNQAQTGGATSMSSATSNK